MTGRALYEKFTDALKDSDDAGWFGDQTDLPGTRARRGVAGNTAYAPRAWPYLTVHDRRVWNALAKRLSPKPKPKKRSR